MNRLYTSADPVADVMDNKNFRHYAEYYNLMYEHKDYNGECQYIDQILKEFAPGATSVIELGSGTGKHANLLNNKGYSVHGIEKSHEMLQKSLEHIRPGLSFEQGDICTFNNDQSFEIAISLFHVVSYLTTNELVLQALNNVYDHLKPGGIFIFDVWHTPAVYTQGPDIRVRRMRSEHLKIIRLAHPRMNFATNVVDVDYDIIVEDLKDKSFFSFKERHSMRHFSLPEISLLASMTGFKIVRSEEFQTGTAPGPDTWGVCYVFKK